MNKMLNLIEQQGGKFSDKDLLDALAIKQIKYGALNYVDDFDAESCVGRNVGERDGYKTPGNMLADGGGVFVVGDIARWSVGLEEKSVENIIYFFWESLKICNFAR